MLKLPVVVVVAEEEEDVPTGGVSTKPKVTTGVLSGESKATSLASPASSAGVASVPVGRQAAAPPQALQRRPEAAVRLSGGEGRIEDCMFNSRFKLTDACRDDLDQ